MKKKLLRFSKTFLPLLLGVFLIWYSLSSATPAEREELWNNILLADQKWVILSVFFGILSHLSRAYRWKFLLEPLGYKPQLANSFMAVMVGYLANLGVPRSGEVLRGATISSYEKVPFDKAFGTIVSERIADLAMVLLISTFGFLIQTEGLINYFQDNDINPFISIGIFLLLIIIGVALLNLVRRSSHPLMVKIKDFARGLLEGMRSIVRMKKKKEFIFHTIFIWTMYLLMFYVIKFAIPETHSLSMAGFMAAFIVGTFAITTTNGGIGVYPIAMGAVLLLFGINQPAGEAFGWIMWGSQTLMVVILGGLSFLFLPLYNQKK
ncbi:lysylphosphatidylglycerol synthase transmembrane domain-containing protein [Salinimicrobium terrae]|uniref:lysylphosphatidylglycerol synthase transmembrane domain-containing protein n=1 Tax=Salinimicrobium terrae TaxID=470866 RepID=UPI000410E6B6|nr:lysylphosphatidylglycerol synthase transmembrane domain-containing protein [Salinimicrobium terrae]